MKKQVWHSGPPPSVGWWPTCSGWLRWWDGKSWSYGAKEGNAKSTIAKAARKKIPTEWHHSVAWQDRPDSWPARSRI